MPVFTFAYNLAIPSRTRRRGGWVLGNEHAPSALQCVRFFILFSVRIIGQVSDVRFLLYFLVHFGTMTSKISRHPITIRVQAILWYPFSTVPVIGSVEAVVFRKLGKCVSLACVTQTRARGRGDVEKNNIKCLLKEHPYTGKLARL